MIICRLWATDLYPRARDSLSHSIGGSVVCSFGRLVGRLGSVAWSVCLAIKIFAKNLSIPAQLPPEKY